MRFHEDTEGQGRSAHAIQPADSSCCQVGPLSLPVPVFLKVPLVALSASARFLIQIFTDW